MSADVAGLLRGLLLVLRDWGLVAVGLEFLVALPLAVLAWRRPLESWERLTWGVVVSSVPKVLLLSFAAERMFARREGWRAPLNRAAERYLFVVIGNALTAVVVALGAALLCLPAYPLSALLLLVVPLVLFERMAPHRAWLASVRRVWPSFWSVLLVSAVLLTLAWLPSSLEWVVLGVRSTNPALVTDTGPGRGPPERCSRPSPTWAECCSSSWCGLRRVGCPALRRPRARARLPDHAEAARSVVARFARVARAAAHRDDGASPTASSLFATLFIARRSASRPSGVGRYLRADRRGA